jgi:regulator of protease activity HflC (stomatin/prohibitin superfamily)
MGIGGIVLLVLILLVLYTLARSVRVIPQSRVGIIQRLGNYLRTAPSGLTLLMPFVDVMLPLIDLREQVVPFDPQSVITADNVALQVATVVYFQIIEPKNAIYQVANYLIALEQLSQTTLRNVFGGLTLDQALTSRDEINARMRAVLDEVTERWGIRMNRVEIKDIIPPKEIQQAMERQMQAERTKRAMILTAEGEKQAAILTAEGQKQSVILQAEGQRQSAILRAEGDGQAIVTVQTAQAQANRVLWQALHDAGTDEQVLRYLYLQMLPQLAQSPANKVFVVPSDMSAVGGFAAIAGSAFQAGQTGQAGLGAAAEGGPGSASPPPPPPSPPKPPAGPMVGGGTG